MPLFRQLVAGISLRSRRFDSRSVRVRCVVEKLTLGQVFLIFVYVLLLPGQTGKDWKPSKNNAVSEIWENWILKCFHLDLKD